MATAFRRGLQNWESARDAFSEFSNVEETRVPEGPDTQQWLPSPKVDDSVLQQLNEQIEFLMQQAFGDIDKDVIEFFNRIEETEDRDFSRMDPIALERLILEIQKVIYIASSIVAERYNAAYWSDRTQQDEYWKAYREPKSVKAKEDRQSFAMQKTRDERFLYYMQFMVWRRLSEKLNALKDLCRTLEFYQQRNSKRY